MEGGIKGGWETMFDYKYICLRKEERRQGERE